MVRWRFHIAALVDWLTKTRHKGFSTLDVAVCLLCLRIATHTLSRNVGDAAADKPGSAAARPRAYASSSPKERDDLLIASADLCWLTCAASAANAAELQRSGGVPVLASLLVHRLSLLPRHDADEAEGRSAAQASVHTTSGGVGGTSGSAAGKAGGVDAVIGAAAAVMTHLLRSLACLAEVPAARAEMLAQPGLVRDVVR